MNTRTRLSVIASRTFLFALAWWILTEGSTASWWFGAPAVACATLLSVAILPPSPIAWLALLSFVPFFLARSVLGGADVAWRAFHPRMPIAPDLADYPLRLPPGLPRVCMVNAVSLLPGTLSAELDRDTLKVHVLDKRKDFTTEIEAVEQYVAAMFGASLNVAVRDE